VITLYNTTTSATQTVTRGPSLPVTRPMLSLSNSHVVTWWAEHSQHVEVPRCSAGLSSIPSWLVMSCHLPKQQTVEGRSLRQEVQVSPGVERNDWLSLEALFLSTPLPESYASLMKQLQTCRKQYWGLLVCVLQSWSIGLAYFLLL
jgi:hypothetical protein